jgi:phosphatase NudJ
MPADPIPTYFFSLVVVRRGDRFVLVQERKYGQTWYLPAGRVEPGETLAEAAVRETREEAGIDIALTGLLRVEHAPSETGTRVRAIFLGEPVGDSPLKTQPDHESLGARWCTLDEAATLPLRGPDVFLYLQHVARGGTAAPLALLGPERGALQLP